MNTVIINRTVIINHPKLDYFIMPLFISEPTMDQNQRHSLPHLSRANLSPRTPPCISLSVHSDLDHQIQPTSESRPISPQRSVTTPPPYPALPPSCLTQSLG